MTNLQENNEKKLEIINKLARLNANMDLCENALPKTVCFVCINSLDKAVEFVTGVEHAQKVLNNMLLIKIEEDSISDNQSYTNEVRNDKEDIEIEISEHNIKLEIVKSDKQQTDYTQTHGQYETLDKDCLDKVEEKVATESVENSSDTIPDQLKLTWKDYSWTCAYCETRFQSVDELKVHSMQYHNCCNAFQCADCNIRKLKLDNFIIHVKSHRKILKLSCYSCYAKFSTPHEVNLHKSTHVTSKYSCHGCNAMFESSEEMNCHTATYFGNRRVREVPMVNSMSDNLTCLLCKKSFKHKGSLSRHLMIHTERKRDHTCKKCFKSFLSKESLSGHMMLHNDSRPFKCEICKAAFKTPWFLRKHVGVHDAQKPFACDQCGRCFRLEKQLSSHKIIHTDLLPFVCTYCNKGFRFKTILKQHIRLHTGVKPYSCDICQHDFTNWPNYNKHMKGRHGTDMSKKKHTPDGVYPINPATGEVIVYPETNSTMEWKKKVMLPRPPGRPKLNLKVNAVETTLSQSENLSANLTDCT
ncbi:uncharacterized protein ACR2FA_010296 [Aphomia sociella]